MAWIATATAALGLVGLGAALEPGPWWGPAIVVVIGLGTMAARGHRVSTWRVVRVGVLVTAALVGVSVADG
jgi:hypothetical protein